MLIRQFSVGNGIHDMISIDHRDCNSIQCIARQKKRNFDERSIRFGDSFSLYNHFFLLFFLGTPNDRERPIKLIFRPCLHSVSLPSVTVSVVFFLV